MMTSEITNNEKTEVVAIVVDKLSDPRKTKDDVWKSMRFYT
jgi:hypothetical protein